MGAKFQGLTLVLIGITNILTSETIANLRILGGEGILVGSRTLIGIFGFALIIAGVIWAVVGSRYRVEGKE